MATEAGTRTATSSGDNLDDYAFALDAMKQVVDLMNVDKKAREGHGNITCPKCQGTIHYTFSRTPGRRSRTSQSFSAACNTPGCVRFAGH